MVPHGVEVGGIGIVRGAHHIDVVLLHQREVAEHGGIFYRTSAQRVGVVAVDTLEEDALAIQRHITEVELLTGDHLDVADVNGDGRGNALDVLYVKKHIAGKFTIKK